MLPPRKRSNTSPTKYSGTSLNGHLPIAATSLTRPLDAVLIEELLVHYFNNTPKSGYLTIL